MLSFLKPCNLDVFRIYVANPARLWDFLGYKLEKETEGGLPLAKEKEVKNTGEMIENVEVKQGRISPNILFSRLIDRWYSYGTAHNEGS